METVFPDPATVSSLQTAVRDFLQERLQPKLDKLNDEDHEGRQRLLTDYQPRNWIADAARRVGQIQQVTHALKYTHPDAKGSNLSVAGNPEAGELLVGTHTLGDKVAPDVVGNAAALDVYKFLRLIVCGKSMLARAVERDPALLAAFSDGAGAGAGAGAQWMEAFAGLPQPKGQPSSHKLAKQVYWPLEDGGYHLLAPLFPTSLTHVAWNTIREDRFSDAAKAAREAHRERAPHPYGYREYRNTVVQKFGGAKPQNISQLNSERYGENYLLPSFPPTWHSESIRPPLHVASVFDGLFGYRPRVRELSRVLRDFLVSVADADSNIRIRNKRAELVSYIRDELFEFAAELHELDPGWSRDPACGLNADEQCWLDPWRAHDDEDFAALLRRGNWKDEICKRFGNWLNARLDTTRTLMGEDEARHWQTVLDKELRMVRMELDFQ